MAIVKYGGGITEFRGSIGGVTFSRNQAGTFGRIRKKPRYQATTPAQTIASALSYYTAIWGYLLTVAQRNAWVALAAATPWTNRLGQTYYPTGLNLFVRSNVLLLIAQQARQDTAPASADEASPAFASDYSVGVGIRITDFDTLASPPTGTLITWWSDAQPLSVYSWSSPWHGLRIDRIVTLAAPHIWVPTADCTASRRYFFRFRVVRDDGTASHSFAGSQDTPAAL
jgi:hypothetical protein